MLIGQTLKKLREQRKMSLSILSKESGVQVATLSRIENLKMTGTLDSHMKIAKALGINLSELYTDIIREDSKIDLQTTQSAPDIFIHSDKASYEVLTNKALSKKMMPILLKIEPGGHTNLEQNPAGTEKFLFVLEGKLEIKIEQETYSLLKNNTLYFDASLKHQFLNTGKSVARVLCVTTPVSL